MKKSKFIVVMIVSMFISNGVLLANNFASNQEKRQNDDGKKDKVTLIAKNMDEAKKLIALKKTEGWEMVSMQKNSDGTHTLLFKNEKERKYSSVEELLLDHPGDKFPDGDYISESSKGDKIVETFVDCKVVKKTVNGKEVAIDK